MSIDVFFCSLLYIGKEFQCRALGKVEEFCKGGDDEVSFGEKPGCKWMLDRSWIELKESLHAVES